LPNIGRLQTSGASMKAYSILYLYYILSLESFRTFNHIELQIVALLERFVPIPLNGAVMNKNVIPGIAADETKTLIIVKPLHCSLFSHLFT
jgi:hypothetical protein